MHSTEGYKTRQKNRRKEKILLRWLPILLPKVKDSFFFLNLFPGISYASVGMHVFTQDHVRIAVGS